MDILANLLKNVDIGDVAQKFGFDSEEVEKIIGSLTNNDEVKKAMPEIAKEGLAQQTKANAESEAEGGFDFSSVLGGLNLDSIFSSVSKDTGVEQEKLSSNGKGLMGALLSKAMGLEGGLANMLNPENLKAMLDKDGDGQITDDLLDVAKNLFSK